MYDDNRLSRYTAAPSASAFQGIKNLILYLSDCIHLPIVNPSGLDVTTTHELCQEVSPGDFHSHNISNGPVNFTDGG